MKPSREIIASHLRAGIGLVTDDTRVLIAVSDQTELGSDACPVCHSVYSDCFAVKMEQYEGLTTLVVNCTNVPRDGSVMPLELLA